MKLKTLGIKVVDDTFKVSSVEVIQQIPCPNIPFVFFDCSDVHDLCVVALWFLLNYCC